MGVAFQHVSVRLQRQEGWRVATLADGEKFGTDWEPDEIGPVVRAYFEMLDNDLGGVQVNKAAKYRDLSALIGRTHKSVERKFQNISAVLAKLEEPWIRGLAPSFHFQEALSDARRFTFVGTWAAVRAWRRSRIEFGGGTGLFRTSPDCGWSDSWPCSSSIVRSCDRKTS